MNKAALETFINFRREVHCYPETAFEEFETRKRIILILEDLGVNSNHMYLL